MTGFFLSLTCIAICVAIVFLSLQIGAGLLALSASIDKLSRTLKKSHGTLRQSSCASDKSLGEPNE